MIPKQKKVLLLLANGYETYEASVFVDVFGWNFVEGDGSTRLYSCGLHKAIKTSFDQNVMADFLIKDINVDDYDALAIPGGFEEYGFYADAYSEEFLTLIRAFRSQGKIIASVCVAALPVGKSGVLAGKRGTTYNQNPRRQEQLKSFGVHVVNDPMVEDDGILTCWNPSAALGVAFRLLEMLTTTENTRNVKLLMGFSN